MTGDIVSFETPGPVSQFPTDAVGKKIIEKAEIDLVMKDRRYCCANWCLVKWRKKWGDKDARHIIEAYRFAQSGMDSTQRMFFHFDILRHCRDYVMKEALHGVGSKAVTGRSSEWGTIRSLRLHLHPFLCPCSTDCMQG